MNHNPKNSKTPPKGRPALPSSEKQSHIMSVKFSPMELAQVIARASSAGMKKSEFVRACALHNRIIPRFSADDLKLIRQLAGEANNLNQIARACNSDPALRVRYAALDVLGKLNFLLDQIQNLST
ncbi:plasmid mobilization protein [Muribaculum intestinale]|uniref:plasmid mobilization protein n=1 Tax=Muribaculum intestinale TaxID=1796646 RepID=UPI003F733261